MQETRFARFTAFEGIAEHRDFTKATAHLEMPSVSHAIAGRDERFNAGSRNYIGDFALDTASSRRLRRAPQCTLFQANDGVRTGLGIPQRKGGSVQ